MGIAKELACPTLYACVPCYLAEIYGIMKIVHGTGQGDLSTTLFGAGFYVAGQAGRQLIYGIRERVQTKHSGLEEKVNLGD